VTSIQLIKHGIECIVIEKKAYPFHRVCGEYISNETVPFLQATGLYPFELNPVPITQFLLTSVNGKKTELPLDLGGFGISRFSFDHYLYKKAKQLGVEFRMQEEVVSVAFDTDQFEVQTGNSLLTSPLVIGSFGKRSKLDATLSRNFFKKKSPFTAVKYHIRTQHPSNLIALHNFEGGYCGISNVEEGKTNVCYLTHRNNVRAFRNIRQMEESVLFKNPHLRKIFESSDFLFEKPETVNEISFETKEPVYNHILMTGDAAGMIAPLCGNGMAMAIHSAKILSDLISRHVKGIDRAALEAEYTQTWYREFAHRLWVGRLIQNKLFGSRWGSWFAVQLAISSKGFAKQIIKRTHGNPF
jgi:flavin-dependent dehydrogenase